MVEDLSPELEAGRPQKDDPEEECERGIRLMYLQTATDPDLLVTKCGTHLTFDGPNDRWQVFVLPTKPEKRCIFCGARAESMEHVIPAWIAKQLAIKGQCA